MKLASLKNGCRDGQLIVVDQKLQQAVSVPDIADTLLQALEQWDEVVERLLQVYTALNNHNIKNSFPLNTRQLLSPLPRCPQWLDGSAYLPHVRRVRKARGADMPDSFLTDPLMYQGASDSFLSPEENIPLADESWGCDFEAEVAIITNDVPMGINNNAAAEHIKLFLLVNDVSLRNLIPAELAKGFGFLHGKPSSSFSPVAVTADELGSYWSEGKVHLPLISTLNGKKQGAPNAGTDMQFNFPTLIAHASKSRRLSAGTIIGSGTVSNADETKGQSCLVEKRVLEIIQHGEASTPYLSVGDEIRIEMLDENNASIFGAIKQQVTAWKA